MTLQTAPQADRLSGVRIVPASIGAYYPPIVAGADLLQVDFDARAVRHDAVYLVESTRDDWRGCRRFQVKPEGVHIDDSGAGDWRNIGTLDAVGLRVAGEVLEVFKPSLGG